MTQHDDGASPADTTHFGYRTVPRADKEGLVREVFDRVADRYDVMNDLMSGGLHRLWKDAAVAWLAPPRRGPFSLIDVAGGTGDIALRVLDAAPSAEITVVDINPAMLEAGRARAARQGASAIRFLEGDAQALAFADESFDAYTIAFGIRNVTDLDRALHEAFRVLRPGGRFLCLEFSRVDVPMLDRLYELYSFNVIPALGRAVVGKAEPYRYLVESIRRFPNQAQFAQRIAAAGFSRVKVRNLTGGVAAMHSAWRI